MGFNSYLLWSVLFYLNTFSTLRMLMFHKTPFLFFLFDCTCASCKYYVLHLRVKGIAYGLESQINDFSWCDAIIASLSDQLSRYDRSYSPSEGINWTHAALINIYDSWPCSSTEVSCSSVISRRISTAPHRTFHYVTWPCTRTTGHVFALTLMWKWTLRHSTVTCFMVLHTYGAL